ncbi:MAG: hypothetical protein JNK82_19945 [Myxococcaceae bacterium]|nr:hypothetical protein [Myxococcaceae bacterium]
MPGDAGSDAGSDAGVDAGTDAGLDAGRVFECTGLTCADGGYCSDAGGGFCAETRACVRDTECRTPDLCLGGRCSRCPLASAVVITFDGGFGLALDAGQYVGIPVYAEVSIAAQQPGGTSGKVAFLDFLDYRIDDDGGVGTTPTFLSPIIKFATYSSRSGPFSDDGQLAPSAFGGLLLGSPSVVRRGGAWFAYAYRTFSDRTSNPYALPQFGLIQEYRYTFPAQWNPVASRQWVWPMATYVNDAGAVYDPYLAYPRPDAGLPSLSIPGKTDHCVSFNHPSVITITGDRTFLAAVCTQWLNPFELAAESIVLFELDAAPAVRFVATVMSSASCGSGQAGLPRLFSSGLGTRHFISVSRPYKPANPIATVGRVDFVGPSLVFSEPSESCEVYEFEDLAAGTLKRNGRVVARPQTISGQVVGACTYDDSLSGLGYVVSTGNTNPAYVRPVASGIAPPPP